MKSDCVAIKHAAIAAGLPAPDPKTEDQKSEDSSGSEESEMDGDIPGCTYKIRLHDGSYLRSKGRDVTTIPPENSDVTLKDLGVFERKCNSKTRACGFISPWVKGLLSYHRMANHLTELHKEDYFIERC